MSETTDKIGQEARIRYGRNMSVDGIGEEGQLRLLGSRVLILGSGALGSVVGAYLAGAGIGRLTLADFDTIDISNLQRQFLFRESDAGKSKAIQLAARLRELNSSIEVVTAEVFVDTQHARDLFSGHDFVVDASDNPDTKYMVDEVCCELGLPYTLGGVQGLRGQLMTHVSGSARYRDFFGESAGAGYTPCSVGGVVGPLPGIIGSMQALEVIKYITGCGRLLTDRLLAFDGRTMQFTQLEI